MVSDKIGFWNGKFIGIKCFSEDDFVISVNKVTKKIYIFGSLDRNRDNMGGSRVVLTVGVIMTSIERSIYENE